MRSSRKSTNTRYSERGNAMVIVLGIIALMGIMMTLTMSSVDNNALAARFTQKRKSTFYVIESTRSIITQYAQNYLSTTAVPTEAGLQIAVDSGLTAAIPTGYSHDQLEVEIKQMPSVLPIPNGPFAGMLGPQTIARFKYRVKSTDPGETQTFNTLDTTISLAQIGMFQFTYFLDLEYGDWAPGGEMSVGGRVHANGDFCISGGSNLKFQKITTSGRIMEGSNTHCAHVKPASDHTYISTGSSLATLERMKPGADHGCTDCDGTGQSWRSYALSRWNGNVMDSAHGVNRLSLPRPQSVYAQYGFNDKYYKGWINTNNLRFIVDPVLQSDPPETAKTKFAYKADIRIIDGIWYLKDPADENAWPGVPIWSDHPGHFTETKNGVTQDVGQDDLRTSWASKGRPWPTGSKPKKFSFYEYDESTSRLSANQDGVVSYGTLARNDSGTYPVWKPGHWLAPDIPSPGAGYPGPDTDPTMRRKSRICEPGWNELTEPALSESSLKSAFDDPLKCASGNTRPVATALLNSTRSGFRDGHLELTQPNARMDVSFFQADLLPMNFSVKDLQAALQDTTPGELGSYFGSGSYMGRTFNGIVWMSLTWPGSEKGYDPVGIPPAAPLQSTLQHPTTLYLRGGNSNDDATQMPGSGAQFGWPQTLYLQQHRGLPYQLCSETPLIVTNVAPGDKYDRADDGSTRFTIPNCNTYTAKGGTLEAYPSVIRITNAHKLDKALFPKGISLVSNLPVYLIGGYNAESDTSDATATDWVSSLVAGDIVTVLSDGWDDALSHWNYSTGNFKRQAKSTTYNTSMITGFARDVGISHSVPLHTVPLLMEWWVTTTLFVKGSTVVGYYPVYARNFPGYYQAQKERTYAVDNRNIAFDPHYDSIANQPPGTPLFYVSSTVNWKIK